jgi:hypothetical protein
MGSWEVYGNRRLFLFQPSEHLVSAISALPIALAVALLALVAASGTMKAPHESTATWTKKRKDWIFLLVAFLALVVAIVGTWITSSLFMAALGTIAALMAIVFGRLALRRSDTFSLLCFVLMGTFLPFAAAYDFTKVSLDSPKDSQPSNSSQARFMELSSWPAREESLFLNEIRARFYFYEPTRCSTSNT